MSYSIENVNGCTKKIVFNFPNLDLSAQIEKTLKETQKKVSLKGFREGKAPLAMIKSLYSPQIESEALNNFIQDELFMALQNEGLSPVGTPSFENIKFEKNKSISFDVVLELMPNIELQDYSSLTFHKDLVEVSSEELVNARKNLLESKAEIVPVIDSSVKLSLGHVAILNFQGIRSSGERPENMKGKDFELVIGSGRFIPGFEDGMIGMMAGEKKNLELVFPADYQESSLRSEKVNFEIELLEIKEKKYPELTLEILKSLGAESEEDLDNKNRQRILAQKEMASLEKLKVDILESLSKQNHFEIPRFLIQKQFEAVKKDFHQNMEKQRHGEEKIHNLMQELEPVMMAKAENQVRGSLILDQLAKRYEISISDSDVQVQYEGISKAYGLPVEEIKKFYEGNDSLKRNLVFSLREEKTFNRLFKELKIS